MKKFIWLLILSSFGASALAQDRTLYEETIYNKPDIGVENEVYLGDRMLAQQIGEWRECITPKRTFTKTTAAVTTTYRRGEPICKTNLKSKAYSPTYPNYTWSDGEMVVDVRWRGKKNSYSLCSIGSNIWKNCVKKLPKDSVVDGEAFIYSSNSFQQTIEYAGRSGDILKFNYSEFSDGFARQAFTREFQVDLSEGNIAAYKGALIEIVEATNVQIKYKVIRNFSSDQ
jgi:hypothetical protein